jgi:hypothetical protein
MFDRPLSAADSTGQRNTLVSEHGEECLRSLNTHDCAHIAGDIHRQLPNHS